MTTEQLRKELVKELAWYHSEGAGIEAEADLIMALIKQHDKSMKGKDQTNE